METKHTPHTSGPWIATPTLARSGFDFAIQTADHSLTICNTFKGVKGDDNVQANARLIAAAPELLFALQRVVNRYGEDCGDHCSKSCVICQCSAAIAKAEKQIEVSK